MSDDDLERLARIRQAARAKHRNHGLDSDAEFVWATCPATAWSSGTRADPDRRLIESHRG